MAAGYSGTPLQQKLGYKEGWRVAFLGVPPKAFGDQFAGLDVRSQARAPLDAAHVFVTTQADLAKWAAKLLPVLGDTGMLWVSWPKKASGVPTDLTENVLRDTLLPTGWVDTKVCAVDETWSGLKFVKRLSERAHEAASGTAGTPRTRP